MTAPNPADVELVADALARTHCWDGICDVADTAPANAESFRHDAKAIVAALAGAGRLVPPDTDTRIEYNLRFRNHSGRWVVVNDQIRDEPENDWAFTRELFGDDCHEVTRIVRSFTDGSQWVGPWVPVPTTKETPHA